MEDLELLETGARAQYNRLQRLVGCDDGHSRLVGESLIQATQQGSSPGEDDASVHDVCGQFRRCLVECELDAIDHLLHRLFDSFAYLSGAEHNGLGETADQVTAPYLG